MISLHTYYTQSILRHNASPYLLTLPSSEPTFSATDTASTTVYNQKFTTIILLSFYPHLKKYMNLIELNIHVHASLVMMPWLHVYASYSSVLK